jgi:peptidoglycan L-alanyl-D-glutamate endopeptidase CwlK
MNGDHMRSMVPQQDKFALDLNLLEDFARHDLCLLVTYGEGWRPDEVEHYYRKVGKSKAKGNPHGNCLAHDLLFYRANAKTGIIEPLAMGDAAWNIIGEYWKTLSDKNRWGGDWKNPHDPWHFERSSS